MYALVVSQCWKILYVTDVGNNCGVSTDVASDDDDDYSPSADEQAANDDDYIPTADEDEDADELDDADVSKGGGSSGKGGGSSGGKGKEAMKKGGRRNKFSFYKMISMMKKGSEEQDEAEKDATAMIAAATAKGKFGGKQSAGMQSVLHRVGWG